MSVRCGFCGREFTGPHQYYHVQYTRKGRKWLMTVCRMRCRRVRRPHGRL